MLSNGSTQRRVRVVLLGGTQAVLQQLRQLLDAVQRCHYTLDWCDDILQTEAFLSTSDYQVALMDCRAKPDQALAELQAGYHNNRYPPIITLTDDIDSALSKQTLQSGADDYLVWSRIDSYLLERCLDYAIGRREIDNKIDQYNLLDPLTNIPNRIQFRQRLHSLLDKASKNERPLALLLLNIDGLKNINESYGSEAGDQMVTQLAQRLSQQASIENLARIGGDEFTLVIPNYDQLVDIRQQTQSLISALAVPYLIDGQPLMVGCSIGVATYPDNGDEVDDLLKRSGLAMREAKRTRGSFACFYSDSSDSQALSERINLEGDMRRALRNNEFELYYQPRVALESGETVGMEALIRWHHPKRGLVSPGEFIPIAEDSGLIMPLGYWIIQRACSDLLAMDKKMASNPQQPEMDIAINLSFKQLQDVMFVDTATRIIQQSGVDASRLEFELTETAIMSDYQQAYDGMMALSKLGVTFSLDDFGTGFSSFAHIQRLPISALKVDRSFIRNVVTDSDDAIIVKAMINLAHSLRLEVVAEGVETLAQVQFLWQNHCDQVQGFYFSPAVSAVDFSNMARRHAIRMG